MNYRSKNRSDFSRGANYRWKFRGESSSKANYHSKNHADQNNRCLENAGTCHRNIVSIHNTVLLQGREITFGPSCWEVQTIKGLI